MSAGQSTTCGICSETIRTPARPIITGYVLCKYGLAPKTAGAIIDMDAHWDDYTAHYAERHPDTPLPERIW